MSASYADELPYSDDADHVYRALSKAAVVALILSALGIAGLLVPTFLMIPAAGLIFGMMGLANIRRYPNELTGTAMAWVAIVLSGLWLGIGTPLHAYIYLTEVPDGYARISFYNLQPEEGSPTPIPASAFELDGQQVFVKGYVHPSSGDGEIRSFVLVPDMKTCCFGGQPKLTDMIEVTLSDPLTVRYSQRRRKLGGVLRIVEQPGKKIAAGLEGGYYRLDADYVR